MDSKKDHGMKPNTTTADEKRWSRLQSLSEKNNRLLEENEALSKELKACHKREEELIDRLVTAQMRTDELETARMANKRRIRELTARQEKAADTGERLSRRLSSAEKDASGKKRIQELEREVDTLTSRLGEVCVLANSKANAWKYIEAQRDRLVARNELAELRTTIEDLHSQMDELRIQRQTAQRECALANTQLVTSERTHAEQVARLEERIEELKQDVMASRRKGAKEAVEEIRQIESVESEELYQSIRELRNEVGWLKYLSTTLQETCNILKQELEAKKESEEELAYTQTEIRRLTRELAECKQALARNHKTVQQNGGAQTDNPTARHDKQQDHKLLWLKVENRRLYRTVESLRMQLSRIDPLYQSNYHFITGV
ncbi:hypothetical protein EG68_09852 [Paragonimus skrjabini miyazakii]|uniref:Uncharacterized protein n=1 Tax=Paragonimus skrjabini miyazakii TaxID=59628 RepID=A0A8S9YCF3_9TREM|nr:hypothetical protein EG68_09852 [Paragonimus skrjabini miyazakii]